MIGSFRPAVTVRLLGQDISAFIDSQAMTRYLPGICWEAKLWCASDPAHLIHFAGERYLGAVSHMTYLEAAIIVLTASERPLSSVEIIERIAEQNLILFTGRTPAATLSAALYRNLGKHPTLRREAKEGPGRAAKGTVRWYTVDNSR